MTADLIRRIEAYQRGESQEITRILIDCLAVLQAPAEGDGTLTDEQIDLIAGDGMRNAAGGIYATSVHQFARACIATATKALQARIRSLSREAWEWSKALEAVTSRMQPRNVIALPPLPPGDRERVYAGHGNEDVVETFSAAHMREYARQAVHEAEDAWQARAAQSNVQPKGLSNTAALYDALTGSPHGSDDATTKSHADAWFAVCAALSEADPDWTSFGRTATDAAVKFINHLATFPDNPSPAPGAEPQEVQNAAWRKWADAGTVASLIGYLATLDQAAPIVTAYHVTLGDGERRCKTRSLTISRERVDHAAKTIRSADTSLPYTHVLWAQPREETEAPAVAHDEPCTYPKCSYPCTRLPDCRDAEEKARQAEPQPTEFCWLVELFLGDGTGNSLGWYHTGFTDLHGNSRSTQDPLKAKRYSTWREANLVSVKLGHTLQGTWRAVQHGFISDVPVQGSV